MAIGEWDRTSLRVSTASLVPDLMASSAAIRKRGDLLLIRSGRQCRSSPPNSRHTRLHASRLHSLNVFQIILERNERTIKLPHRLNPGKFTRQPPQLPPQRLIHTTDGV